MRSRYGFTPVVVLALMVAAAACSRRPQPSAPPAGRAAPPPRLQFVATASSIEGRTASGAPARKGVVAADPDVLPLGSRIRVHGAGQYSGEYVVRDTGPAVQGREIDVYLASAREAKVFGRKQVEVEVLEYGEGRRR